MFDLAFSELIVIGIVALVVIGPEKLPKLAHSAGRLIGRIQRYASAIKSDLDNELRIDDLQRLKEELQQNVQAGMPAYQIGQVIDHTQVTDRKLAQSDTAALQKTAANADSIETEAVDATPLKRSLPD